MYMFHWSIDQLHTMYYDFMKLNHVAFPLFLSIQHAEDQLSKLEIEKSDLLKQEEDFRKKEEELKKKERLTPWNIDTLCKEGQDKTVSVHFKDPTVDPNPKIATCHIAIMLSA